MIQTHIMIYDICHISYMCGHMHAYQERVKCGYGRMVKFLFAKEKMRVRFPLSAHGEVMYYYNRKYKRENKKFSILIYVTTIVASVVVLCLPFFSLVPIQKRSLITR